VSDVVIDGTSLTVRDVVRVAREKAQVVLSPEALLRVRRARDLVERLVRDRKVVYGVTTGFGKFAEVTISAEQAEELQMNLLKSHAVGVGDPLPEEVTRAVMLLRANALAKGYSGVREEVVLRLLDLLNSGVHPVIPAKGSLGASGDLAPLAHLALVLVGRGEAVCDGELVTGAEALRRRGLRPLQLAAKEGLALINGTQVMTAITALAYHDAEVLARCSDCVAALTGEALRVIPEAYHRLLHEVRPHPGAQAVASNLRQLLQGSRLVAKAGDQKVQDAYALRCIPQVHGAVRDALKHVGEILQRELNAATDNPLVFPDEGVILSGGNFHGEPVALAADYLGMATAELGSISERRIERLVNPHLSRLPAFLTDRGGLNSGFMIAQYTAAALASENKVLASPAVVDSIPASANQEDHVSMGAVAARKAREIVWNVTRILAIEWMCAAQAVEFLDPSALGRGTRAIYQLLRQHIPPLESDRELAPEVEKTASLLGSSLLAAVESALGPLA